MNNYAMPAAVATVGLGLLSIGFNLNDNEANATPAAFSVGPAEPSIVAFGSLGLATGDSSTNARTEGGFYRLWSDGRLEVRKINFLSATAVTACGSAVVGSGNLCGNQPIADTGWIELPVAPGDDGFACRGDINGDRNVDSADLGLLIAQWGQDISCDPQPSYPCFDLNGLNMNIAAR
jgi:hypothetical protein